MKHTKLPLHIERGNGFTIRQPDGVALDMENPEIVSEVAHMVNNYPALVESLKNLADLALIQENAGYQEFKLGFGSDALVSIRATLSACGEEI